MNSLPLENIKIVKDNEIVANLHNLILNAKSEIIISTFKLQTGNNKRTEKLRGMIQLLLEKLKQGVNVKVLMNWKDSKKGVPRTNEPVANELRAAGADVRYFKSGRCCHSKIIITDKIQVIIGSHNWSAASWGENFETSLLIKSEAMAKKLRDVFLNSFNDAARWL